MFSRALPRLCDGSATVSIRTSDYCDTGGPTSVAPIDSYYRASADLIVLGSPTTMQQNSTLGRLLLLGLVSATESYVRSVLVRLLDICPHCRQEAGSQVLPLSSVYYYAQHEVPLGLFDGRSLAGDKELRSVVQKVSGYKVPEVGPLAAALVEFDKICHFRHAAVHAHGVLGTGNASAVGLPSNANPYKVRVNFAGLQQAGLVCRAVVQELNQFLFESSCKRWIAQSTLDGDYATDRERWLDLYSLFRSLDDAASRKRTPKQAYTDVYAASARFQHNRQAGRSGS